MPIPVMPDLHTVNSYRKPQEVSSEHIFHHIFIAFAILKSEIDVYFK